MLPMQIVFCKHTQNDLCLSKTNLVVQTLKLLLPCLDLAWHKYKEPLLGLSQKKDLKLLGKEKRAAVSGTLQGKKKSDTLVLPLW